MEQQLQRIGRPEICAQAEAIGDPIRSTPPRIHRFACDHGDAWNSGFACIDQHTARLGKCGVGMQMECDHVAVAPELAQDVDPLLVRSIRVTPDEDVASRRELGFWRPGSSSAAEPEIGQLSGSARRSTSLIPFIRAAIELLPAEHGFMPTRVARAHQAVPDRVARALGTFLDRERGDHLALQLGTTRLQSAVSGPPHRRCRYCCVSSPGFGGISRAFGSRTNNSASASIGGASSVGYTVNVSASICSAIGLACTK